MIDILIGVTLLIAFGIFAIGLLTMSGVCTKEEEKRIHEHEMRVQDRDKDDNGSLPRILEKIL